MALLTVPAPGAAAGPQDGRDVVSMSGECSAGSTWTLAARSRALRVQVGARVSSPGTGQQWRLRLAHNGRPIARGRRLMRPNGSITIRRATPNEPGIDQFAITARNRTTGEICRGVLAY